MVSMIARAPFRIVLPVLMVVMNLGILFWASHFDRENPALKETAVQSSHDDGMVSFSPNPVEPSWWLLVALMMSLPAVFAGALVALVLHCGSDIGVLSCSIVFIPPLWYIIGRRLDVWTGAIQRSPTSHAGRREVVRLIFRFFAGCIVIISVLGILDPHHRTMKRDFELTVLFIWCGSYFALALTDARRRQMKLRALD